MTAVMQFWHWLITGKPFTVFFLIKSFHQEMKGNPVGSLTKEQRDLVVGCLIGDGYMRLSHRGRGNAAFQIAHSVKQREYVVWKYSKLREFVKTPPKRNGPRGFRFVTRFLPEFTRFYEKFYGEGKKIIPHEQIIAPLALAVWYMTMEENAVIGISTLTPRNTT
jgi:hypothetical protein